MGDQVIVPPSTTDRPVEVPTWAAEPEVTAASVSAREEAIADLLRGALAQGHSDEALADILRKVLAGASPQAALTEPEPAAPVFAEPVSVEPVFSIPVEPVFTVPDQPVPVLDHAVPAAPVPAAPMAASDEPVPTPVVESVPAVAEPPAPVVLSTSADPMWGTPSSCAPLWGEPAPAVPARAVTADAPIWAEDVVLDEAPPAPLSPPPRRPRPFPRPR